jgi:L-ribulokinase
MGLQNNVTKHIDSFVIGVDYGTDSVRSVIINTANGEEISSSTFYYPRWIDGLFCNAAAQQFRQHPLDYIEGLERTIKDCLVKAGAATAQNIKAISVDTTGSTPVAVDETGTPLSLQKAFENNPHAMFVLWKDHTAIKEAEEINAHAIKFETNYLQFVGGIYSSEWYWAKLLKTLRADDAVQKACYAWVEHCDWIPFLLTGAKHISEMKVGVCAAGHKALWSDDFNGLPPNDFFATLDPLLDGFTTRLFKKTYTADKAAGIISAEWAKRLGLPQNVVIGVGAFDAHMGAVGGQIEPYHLSKVMGTSTCDILVAPASDMKGKLVKGICGQVNGSVLPGMIGLEAGQSAFGDTYAWWKKTLIAPIKNILATSQLFDEKIKQLVLDEMAENIIPLLTSEAKNIPLTENDMIATDWLNGRRTPDANQKLKAGITGLNLGSDAAAIFKSLVESTCFGAKKIASRFAEEGIPVKGLIGLGGVAKKSPFIMQMMADVMNMPIRIHKSEQTCAAGAAMFAATAAGIYNKVEDAMTAMGQGFEVTYFPDKASNEIYEKRYQKYMALGKHIEQITL